MVSVRYKTPLCEAFQVAQVLTLYRLERAEDDNTRLTRDSESIKKGLVTKPLFTHTQHLGTIL
jgi:hypothetical protein